MQRFCLTGPYQPPVPLVFELRARHIEVVYSDPPRISLAVGGGWSRASVSDTLTVSAFRYAPPRERQVSLSYQQAVALDDTTGSAWGSSTETDIEQAAQWSMADPLPAVVTTPHWSSPDARDVGITGAWLHAIPRDQDRLELVWKIAIPTDASTTTRHRDTDRYGDEWVYVEQLPPYMPGSKPLAFRFNGSRYLPARNPLVFFRLGRSLRDRPTQPRDQRASLRHGTPAQIDLDRSLLWSWGAPIDPVPTGIEYPDYDGPVVIIEPMQPPAEPDILESYMIANTVTLVVLPDRTPLDAQNIKVALDIDSFSWSFSADLKGQTSLNLVRPNADGQKTVEVDINGWKWQMLIERYSRTQKFPAEHYSINGASRSQLLAAPYAPARSAVNSAAVTARQAVEAQLSNTGFTLTWDAAGNSPADWTLPAGALSYQNQTALQVIARIAAAAGAVVRPARDSDALSVLPRYRAPVWEWPTAVMDRIIPTDIVTALGGEWAPQPAWNSCYVSGSNYGVAMDVRRAGTAGDNPAPDVLDDLITGTEVARQRGICEISQGGNQEIVSQVIPLFAASTTGNPGLVEPAMLCEIRGDGDTWRGLCLSTEISADGVGAARVTQTLRLERHTGGGY